MFDKAYLIKAFYQWCVDKKYQPHIEFSVEKNSNINIPKDHIDEHGNVIINIAKGAAGFIEIENDKLYAEVSFDKKIYKLGIDINTINWIRASEIEEYLYLNNDDKFNSYYTAVQKNNEDERKYHKEKEAKIVGMKPEIIQDWIVENSARLTKLLGVNDWHIKYIVVKQTDKVSKQNEADPDGCAGDCTTSYEYKSATIRIFATEVKNEEELERVMVHELAHVATASLELYAKYFEGKHLYLESEKKIAERLRYDIYELLAMQVENIVMGKLVNKIEIWDNSSRADAQFRMHCEKFGVTNHKVIADVNSKPEKKSSLEIVEEEKKYDPDYYYKKYRESSELVENKKSSEEKDNLYSFLSRKLSKASDSTPKIIIPGKPEEKYIVNIEILLPSNYKKAA